MAKKKTTKRSAKKVSPTVKKIVKARTKIAKQEKEPDYMVQVHEPTNLRKNVLESLREIIIFMQSYEKFRQIQEEKVNIFNELKESIKQLTGLLDRKLKHHFPKGKLSISTVRTDIPKMAIPSNVENVPEESETAPARKAAYVPESHPITELDELESQLRDIEGQLRKIS